METITFSNIEIIKPLDMAKAAKEALEEGMHVEYLETAGNEFPDQTLYVLCVDGSRFGLCLNGDSLWTDADDLEDAIRRYETGEMIS